jgi:ABC-type transport system involved in multi-copper enzyme maturation permease subunit
MLTTLASIARFTVIEAVRTRLLWVASGLLVGVALAAEFAAALALTDSQGYRLGVYGALSRLALVFVIALFVSASVVRELQDRLLDLTLSRPVPRASWFLGRLAGFAAAAVALAILAVFPLMFFAPASGALAWGASLAAELWLVAAACLTCVITLSQVTLALIVVAAFYLLSRAMSAIVLMSSGPAVDPNAWSSAVIEQLVELVALLLPALDRFTQAGWLTAAAAEPVPLGDIALQTLIYSMVLIAIGLFDFYRREY